MNSVKKGLLLSAFIVLGAIVLLGTSYLIFNYLSETFLSVFVGVALGFAVLVIIITWLVSKL